MVQTEQSSKEEAWRPRAGEVVVRHAGGRYESIRSKAKRRRLVANVIVVSSTGAVLLLAVVFHALLTR